MFWILIIVLTYTANGFLAAQSASRESLEEGDYSFSYPPYAMTLPIFVNLQQRQMWEKGMWLSLNMTCAKFLPAQVLRDKVAVCNSKDPKGFWSDVLLVRTGSTIPLLHACNKMRNIEESGSDAPGPDAIADISRGGGDPSWSIQGFLGDGGPAMNIAQNIEMYNRYKSKVMIETRVESILYNFSLTVNILKKAGFGGDRIVKLCASGAEDMGGDFQTGCTNISKPTLSLGCSRSLLHPQTAQKFRDLMGVKAFNSDSQGTVVLFSRSGRRLVSGTNNGARRFANYEEVKTAMGSVCAEYGLKLVVQERPITDVDALTQFLGHTVLIVGAHGGALHNHWFLPSGSGLIEITGEAGRSQGSSWFYKPVAVTDVLYAPLYAKAVPDKRPDEGLEGHLQTDWRNSDIMVNTTELKQLMHIVIRAVAKKHAQDDTVGAVNTLEPDSGSLSLNTWRPMMRRKK